ncbi:MAG: fasciclin domain-containing protein, partial [Chloroflexota bacterium]
MGDDEEMAEATEEPMDDEDMGDDEEMDDMDDMSDVAVVTFEGFADDEDTFTFDYPEGYELTESDNAVNLAMGDQTLVVIAPPRFNTVFGTTIDAPAEGTEENLILFVERLGYTAGETSDMMMAAESINIELLRRGLVGFANLIDLGDGLFGVVLELGPDADNVPSSDGAIIGESMSFTPAPPPPPEEDMEDAEAESADDEGEEGEEESDESEDSEESDDEAEASDEEMAEEPTLTIVGLALNTDGLSTLGTAVARAGFVSTLNGEGPFTVFAPTDEAFEVALEALGLTAAELLAEENRDLLTSVLTYHVVSGAVLSTDLEDGMEVETLNGAILTVGVSDDGVTLTDGTGAVYNVTVADVMASNGVVHVIDGVLLPPADE